MSVRLRSDDVTETAEPERPNITGRPTQVDSVSGEQKDKKKKQGVCSFKNSKQTNRGFKSGGDTVVDHRK